MPRLQTSTKMGGDGESDFTQSLWKGSGQFSEGAGRDPSYFMTLLKVFELFGMIRLKD